MRQPHPPALPLTAAGLAGRLGGLAPGRAVALVLAVAVGALTSLYLATGLLWDRAVSGTAVGQFDRAVAQGVVERRGPWGDAADVGSQLADTVTIVVGLVAVVTVLVVLRRWSLVVLVGGALAVEIAVFLPVSYLVGRDRPAVETIGGVPGTGSFPSGHAAAAVCFYGAVAVVVRWEAGHALVGRVATGVAAVAALAVGGARVYQGLHYVTDVAAGLLLGVLCLFAARVAAHAVAAAGETRAADRRRGAGGQLRPARRGVAGVAGVAGVDGAAGTASSA